MSPELEFKLTIIALIVLFVSGLAILSANCLTGDSCNFANAEFTNWFMPKLKLAEDLFWQIVSG